ncbi:MAG: amino acid permease [FCB group bacterium]|jgi:APA family basic amino acid/polyamine antiporter
MTERDGKESEYTFKKSLNLLDSTAIVVGSMIGSGIFIVAAEMSRTLGSPGWLLIAWAIAGVMTIIGALSYGELAAMMPHAGGQYVYLREAYNPLTGFLYGWTLFLVIQTGTIAAVAMAFAKFTGVLIPWFSESNIYFQFGYIKLNTVQLLAIASIVILTLINLRGVSKAKVVQNIFTFTKVAALVGLIAAGLFFARSALAHTANAKIFWEILPVGASSPVTGIAIITVLGTAMVGSIFASVAWDNITFTAGEVINPKKNIPLSLFFGTTIVVLIYILANYVYVSILPLRGLQAGATVYERGIQFAQNDRVGTSAMSIIFGNYAAIIMAIFIMISTFGCNNGLILGGARVYYAMAKDGLFFKKTGILNNKSVPGNGLLIQCIWASLLCLSGTYTNLLDYVVFAVLLFYLLAILSLFILRIKKPQAERPYKAFGYPLIPAIFIILAISEMIILLIYKPNYTWPGLIIVVLGIPAYFIWRRVNKK